MGFVGVRKVRGEASRCGLAIACECLSFSWGLGCGCCDPRQKVEWALPVKNYDLGRYFGFSLAFFRLNQLPYFMPSHQESFSPGQNDRCCLEYFSYSFSL